MPYRRFSFSNYKATTCYIFSIVLTNSLFMYLPTVKMWGSVMSPADITVGCIYIFRDFSQREIKSYVLAAMLVGGLLSYVFADSTIALASLGAFFVGELIDWALFTWTKKPLSARLLVSSICSCPLDSLVFLAATSRLSWLEFIVMTLFKFIGIFLVWGYWWKAGALEARSFRAFPHVD